MTVILFATGMVGAGVLIECLADARVASVRAVSRTPLEVRDPRLRELIRSDFLGYSDAKTELTGHDACFFCLDVSSAGVDEVTCQRTSYAITVSAAERSKTRLYQAVCTVLARKHHPCSLNGPWRD